jgi:hypothetical protein
LTSTKARPAVDHLDRSAAFHRAGLEAIALMLIIVHSTDASFDEMQRMRGGQ